MRYVYEHEDECYFILTDERLEFYHPDNECAPQIFKFYDKWGHNHFDGVEEALEWIIHLGFELEDHSDLYTAIALGWV